MKSFSSYLDSRSKKFVGLFFSEESQDNLREWALANGFDLTSKFNGDTQLPGDFDFHTTIFFTTSEHDTKNGDFDIVPFNLDFSSFELLGLEKNIPVIKINTENAPLQKIRQMFVDQGYKDAWPAYKPHISLSYKYSGEPDLTKLLLPKIKVTANMIRVKDQTAD